MDNSQDTSFINNVWVYTIIKPVRSEYLQFYDLQKQTAVYSPPAGDYKPLSQLSARPDPTLSSSEVGTSAGDTIHFHFQL